MNSLQQQKKKKVHLNNDAINVVKCHLTLNLSGSSILQIGDV